MTEQLEGQGSVKLCPRCDGSGRGEPSLQEPDGTEGGCLTCHGEGLAPKAEEAVRIIKGTEHTEEFVKADPKLRKKIHEITNLLCRRVVGETAKKNPDCALITKFNQDADDQIIAMFKALKEKV